MSDRLSAVPQKFAVQVTPERGRVVVSPCGELDVATVESLDAAIDELVGDGWEMLLLDLRELTFIDSTGLSLVIRQTSRADARVEIVDGEGPVARLFDLAGVRRFLPFVEATAPRSRT